MSSYSSANKNFLLRNIENPNAVFVTISFFILCLFIRLPFFFQDYIDHDESTFIIMGQSLVDGNLPYTELWDLKPPFVFYYFAAIIQLFGKSLIAIRFSAVFVITITACFVFLIGKNIKSGRFGFYNGLGYIVLSSLFGTMQGVMSEHLAMLFCVGGFYTFLKFRQHAWGIFISALVFGFSLMFRLNLVYSYFILFSVYLFTSRLSLFKMMWKGLLISVGLLFASLLGFLPYLFQGIQEVWWSSVVNASYSYASIGSGNVFGVAKSLSVCVLLLAISFLFSNRIAFFTERDKNVWYVKLFTFALIFMLIKGGRLNGHYLVQLYPFMLFIVLEVFSVINFYRLKKARYLLLILLLIPAESYLEYGKLGKRLVEDKSLYNGESFEVSEYIKKNRGQDHSVLFLSYHIGYWLLNVKPPSKIGTHPSNLLRTYLYPHVDGAKQSPMHEIRSLFENKPIYIVNKYERLYFARKDSEANIYYKDQIKKYYKLVKEFGRAKVYKRI